MNAAELLEQAQAEGVLLVLDDGRLTWEADREPPGELLEGIRTHRLEIIAALSSAHEATQRAWDWLASVACLLECSPEHLLQHCFLLPDELAMYCNTPPHIAALTISTHPDWHHKFDRTARVLELFPKVSISVSTETAEFREQYAQAREGGLAAAHSSPTWRAARDALHRHAYGNCPHCFPPKGRYCAVGAELLARYDYETSALETHHE
ncbi:hypothetical protein [Aquipseudomonas alcaligenes]|uniref:TubC N-terminal docking domain-containing protein n=1 Tax=Aquipseudomonas alcaligenes TaxID=43263 RepID=A0AA42MYI6_AQUAC|nr:hypothetical protein [Pseudomonas alcaligenes]MDH1054116.1 hypothetical protein [Pseudomonas alcaligenes]